MADIFNSSRYNNSVVDYLQKTTDGPVTPIVFYSYDDITVTRYKIHVYAQGERFDQLSFKYYGNPHMWWVFPEYNPEIRDFFNIEPGTRLRVPLV